MPGPPECHHQDRRAKEPPHLSLILREAGVTDQERVGRQPRVAEQEVSPDQKIAAPSQADETDDQTSEQQTLPRHCTQLIYPVNWTGQLPSFRATNWEQM